MRVERIRVIAINTFRESVRSKLLYSVLFFAAMMVAISALFGSVTIGDQVKVIKDFGLFAISFFSVAYAVISGATLLHKELSRKTVYNILAKPVPRAEFLCGKYCGMLITVALMIGLMTAALLVFCFFFEQRIDWLLPQAAVFIVLQLLIVCACTIFFSAIVVTPMLSGAFAFGIFLAGRSSEYVLHLIERLPAEGGLLRPLLHGIYWLLPHLNDMDVASQTVYGISAGAGAMGYACLYAAAYAGALLVLATLIFSRREFN